MMWGVLATLVMVAHLAYVSFVVVGQLVILVGMALKWSWIRNPWFRWAHLVMICVVALEAIIEFECPLTTLQDYLERMDGRTAHQGGFIERLVNNVLFSLPDELYPWIYIGFALLVVATFFLAPPRRLGHGSSRANGAAGATVA